MNGKEVATVNAENKGMVNHSGSLNSTVNINAIAAFTIAKIGIGINNNIFFFIRL